MKNWIQLLGFLFMLIALDLGIGKILSAKYCLSHDDSILRMRYVWSQARPSWVVLGSSRALHHYNVQAIQLKTNLKNGLNAGMDGQGLLTAKLFLTAQQENSNFKLAILDLAAGILTDIHSDEKLAYIYPEIDQNSILKEDLLSHLKAERWKFYSSIFPYNSKMVELFIPKQKQTYQEFRNHLGYIALQAQPSMRKISQDLNLNSPEVQGRVQSNIELFKEIIAWCASHQITLVNVISPIYHKSSSTTEVLNRFKNVAPILDCSDLGNDNPDWFNDDFHLNEKGAYAFSNHLCKELIKLKNP
jgi:hypothetical protein